MAKTNAEQAGEPLRLAMLEEDTPRAQLALDGVSCSLCHAIDPDPADPAKSFGGNYALVPTRDLLGPHDNPDASPMLIRTAFLPRKGDHVRDSVSCASCHTLFTGALDASGRPTGGQIAEQTPYLEWRNSAFNDEVANPGPDAASCQDCHTPTTDVDGNSITTRIARGGGGQDYPQISPRDPFGRHVFVGGNVLVPAILRDQRADLRPVDPDAAFDAILAETRDPLRNRTGRVSVGAVTRSRDAIEVPVTVENLTGHKLPTGHPTREAWLRVRGRDAQGAVVFASGEHDARGRIVDGAGRPLASERAGGPVQPHRDRVTAADQVQIYEALMKDGAGDLTYLLLRGEGYLKDDRLLPRGWDPAHPDAAAAGPAGPGGDADFTGGRDTVVYAVPAPAAGGPYTVEAALLFQPLSARFVDELFQYATPEVEAFETYYQAADPRPALVDEATAAAP